MALACQGMGLSWGRDGRHEDRQENRAKDDGAGEPGRAPDQVHLGHGLRLEEQEGESEEEHLAIDIAPAKARAHLARRKQNAEDRDAPKTPMMRQVETADAPLVQV
jgi:hypothetical protein